MIATIMKNMGADQLYFHSWLVIFFAIVLFCALCGWLAMYIAPEVSFGLFGNMFVLFVSMWGGLIAYSQYVSPLRLATALTITLIAVGSAIAGLMVLCLIKSRPFQE